MEPASNTKLQYDPGITCVFKDPHPLLLVNDPGQLHPASDIPLEACMGLSLRCKVLAMLLAAPTLVRAPQEGRNSYPPCLCLLLLNLEGPTAFSDGKQITNWRKNNHMRK